MPQFLEMNISEGELTVGNGTSEIGKCLISISRGDVIAEFFLKEDVYGDLYLFFRNPTSSFNEMHPDVDGITFTNYFDGIDKRASKLGNLPDC